MPGTQEHTSKKYAFSYISNEIKCPIYLHDMHLIYIYIQTHRKKTSKIKQPHITEK